MKPAAEKLNLNNSRQARRKGEGSGDSSPPPPIRNPENFTLMPNEIRLLLKRKFKDLLHLNFKFKDFLNLITLKIYK
jgi:hypothetical protein